MRAGGRAFSSRSAADMLITAARRPSFKDQICSGQPALGALTAMHRETAHVEMLGMLGYDYLWLDTEHSTATPASAEAIILAAERRGLTTIVRVASAKDPDIMKYLVTCGIISHVCASCSWSGRNLSCHAAACSGAGGVLVPQCDSAEEARSAVRAVKFPPIGHRELPKLQSFCYNVPSSALHPHCADVTTGGLAGDRWNEWNMNGDMPTAVARANKETVVGVQIESLAGIEAIDEILAVEHIDWVFLGPTDLSVRSAPIFALSSNHRSH
eukprot:SAG11_NODE_1278_length_5317_cov_4.188386_2_plen_270_part_00